MQNQPAEPICKMLYFGTVNATAVYDLDVKPSTGSTHAEIVALDHHLCRRAAGLLRAVSEV
jgi:hypothetical protein